MGIKKYIYQLFTIYQGVYIPYFSLSKFPSNSLSLLLQFGHLPPTTRLPTVTLVQLLCPAGKVTPQLYHFA